ncbi:hypothetical protein N9J23_01950, partial [Flavobacteriaceae bacterium]|nr:hypothetical protein [Flavobacteriaceae bacterium]
TADKTYNYTITSNGTSCVDATLDGVITINPVTAIVLNSAASTLNQQICINSVPPDNFDDIIFDVTGGASGVSISHTRTDPLGTVTGPFVGMPLNLPDNILNAAGDQIIISGQPNDAALTETTIYTITVSTTLNTNGCDEASTSFNIVASPGIEISEPVDINDWKTKNVSCFGLADGAINIPSAAITGGIEATAKEVRLDIGGAPVETDALLVTLNGTIYTYTIRDLNGRIGEGGAVESNSSIANGLAALINNDLNLNITATVDFYGAGTLRLLADVAGTDFTHAIAVGAGDTVTLNDDVVQVNSNVSYVYRWTRNGAAYPAGNGLLSLDNLDPGEYQLTVSINDTTTCAATVRPITITQPNDVTVTITSDCAGAHTASVGAGTGIVNQNYIYDIVDENGNDIPALQFGPTTANSYSFNVNPGADYIVKVTVITDNGVAGDDCTYLSNIFTAWNSLVLDDTDVVVTDEQCFESDNGAIVTSGGNLSINGGSGAYNYSWSGPGGYTSTDQDIYDLSPGDYTVTVTDQNNANCSEITSFTINPATQIIIDPNANNTQQLFCPVVNPDVIGDDWGTIEIDVTGGSGDYNITWKKMPSGVIVSATQNDDKILRIKTPGLYVVEVADANTLDECIVSTDFNITGSVVPLSATIALDDPGQLQGNNVVFTNTGCNGSEIPIEINFQGGNGSYEYNISSGTSSGTWTATASGTSRVIENLNAGEYVIQVRDIGGCTPVLLSATSSGTTLVNRVIVNDVSTDELAVDKGQTNIIDIDCSSNIQGFIEISIGGGLPPYRVVWEGPQTNEIHTDINGTTDSLSNISLPGDYTATVYDSSDCGEPVIEEFTVEDGSDGSLGKPEITATIQSCGSDQLPEATIVLEKSDDVEIYWETLGNITTKNNQVNEIVILNPVAGDVYTVNIDGTSFNYTSTTSQTNLDVLIGLEAVITSASVSTSIVSSTIEEQNKLVITAVEQGREIQVQASAVLSSGSFGFISNSLTTLAIESRSGYTKIPDSDGAITIYDLTPGYYHAVVTEESSCVTWITDDIYITSGEFELVNTGLVYSSTCSDQNQTVSADYKFTLLGGASESVKIELNGINITNSNNLVSNGNRFIIKNLTEGEYNLLVSDSSSPTIICPVNRTFEITPNIQIGFTDEGYLSDPIEIPLCESYIDFTLNESLVTGGTPFFNSAGIDYYSYLWITPDGTRILNKTSFRAVPGVYELRIEDSNGCTNNLLEPILVEFSYPHDDIEISPGLIDDQGNEVYTLPESCGLQANDGRISLNITGGAPDLEIKWYELNLTTVVSETEIIEWQGLQDIINAPSGTYKMVISAVQGNQSFCSGKNIGYNYSEIVVTVEDDKSLVIQDGPFVSDELCSGKPGILLIDVIDSEGSDIEFRYGSIENNSKVNSTRIDEDTYEVYIFEPEESSYLFIFNDRGCGEISQINLELGTPAFEYSSVNSEQGGGILANEPIDFKNESTQPYSRWVWNFGDGNIKELPESRDTNDSDGDGISNYQEDELGFDKNDPSDTPPDADGDGIADGIKKSGITTHSYPISGTYYVTLRIFNSLGCYEEITKPISVGRGYYVLKPNVFTPFASEEINDEFNLLISGFVNYNFTVYDYKGNLVYSETDEEDDPLNPTGLEIYGWDAKGGFSNNGSTTIYSAEHNGSPYYVFVFQGTLLKDWDTDPKVISENGTFILLD